MNKKAAPEASTLVFGTSPLSSKGQLVLPAKLRKLQKLQQGDMFIFTGVPGSSSFQVLKATASAEFEKNG